MTQIALRRGLSGIIAHLGGEQTELQCTGRGWQDKSADHGRAHVVGWVGYFRHCDSASRRRLLRKSERFQSPERHRTCLKMSSPR